MLSLATSVAKHGVLPMGSYQPIHREDTRRHVESWTLPDRAILYTSGIAPTQCRFRHGLPGLVNLGTRVSVARV